MDNRQLNFQEQFELNETIDHIKELQSVNKDYLHTGDHAIYHVDFKTRKLKEKIILDNDIFSVFEYINENN